MAPSQDSLQRALSGHYYDFIPDISKIDRDRYTFNFEIFVG